MLLICTKNHCMRSAFLIIVLMFFVFGCNQKNSNPKNLDKAWLDSIIKKSDSSYTRPYFRTDFVNAQYYVNTKDSTLTQLMKDSAGRVRQIIIMKKDIRIFYAQYYTNGHIQADLPLDVSGQYHGIGNFYYESGQLDRKST